MATKIYLRLILLLLIALVLRVCITHRTVELLADYTADRLPATLASQPGEDLPLTPFEVELLAPDGGRILQRRYGQGDTVLWLAAVQSRTDWRVQHPPQICYVAQGWRIEEQGKRSLRDREGHSYDFQRMVAVKNGERRIVYYFYTDGRHWTASYFNRVIHTFLDRAIWSKARTWVLIQLSCRFAPGQEESSISSAFLELATQNGGEVWRSQN